MRRKFEWTDENTLITWFNSLRYRRQGQVFVGLNISVFRSYFSAVDLASIFLVLPFLIRFLLMNKIIINTLIFMIRIVGLHDLTICLIASISSLSKNLIYYFAETPDVIYLSLAASIFGALVNQPLRSSITKVAGEGKDFIGFV